MHPAVSVILFTVTSGAGFGFIAMIGLGAPVQGGWPAALLACVIAGGLAVVGLLSSTFHLGHPERAWRAFSQWRSSWLSREGVLAVLTLILFAIYGAFWVFAGVRISALGLLLSFSSLLTVFATAMIYAQLRTVPRWNSRLTPLSYLAFAFAGGFMLAAAFSGAGGTPGGSAVAWTSLLLLVVAWLIKFAWWRRADATTLEDSGSSMASATGLGGPGTVRLFEPPHTGPNYLTKEMVHVIGRKHARKLRAIAVLLGGVLPALVLVALALLQVASVWIAPVFLLFMVGLFAERWLFFAEAEHAVSLYYGRPASLD